MPTKTSPTQNNSTTTTGTTSENMSTNSGMTADGDSFSQKDGSVNVLVMPLSPESFPVLFVPLLSTSSLPFTTKTDPEVPASCVLPSHRGLFVLVDVNIDDALSSSAVRRYIGEGGAAGEGGESGYEELVKRGWLNRDVAESLKKWGWKPTVIQSRL
eukprot:GHVS01042478.1.p2 GENE.GHVS01042478.1~~GHVS01042478.1.p2  ORF type:complete len:157 (-),score=26.99 GHVS01042478.1:1487-1957(-)